MGADRAAIARARVWFLAAAQHPAYLHFGGVAVHALASHRPARLLLAAGVLPMFVDCQWAGVGSVLLAWIAFRHRAWWLLLVGLAAVCWANHNGWALLAIPVVLLATRMPGQLPRCRWAFYGYHVGDLAFLAAYTVVSG